MLDIEFVQAERPNLRQHVLYAYKSGVARRDVLARLQHLYTNKGLTFSEATYDNIVQAAWEPSLFGASAVLIDLEKASEVKTFKEDIAQLLHDLAAKAIENSVILLCPEELKEVLDNPNWAAAARNATSLEEPSVTTPALPKLLDYLYTASDTYDFRKLTNKPALQSAVTEVLVAEDKLEFPDLKELLELISLTCIDTTLNTFDIGRFRRFVKITVKEDFYKTHKLVFDFLATRTQQALTALVQDMSSSIFVKLKEPRMVLGGLHAVTRDLFSVNATLNPAKTAPEKWPAYKHKRLMDYSALPTVHLFFWFALLLKHEPTFSEHSFTYAMHLLGNDFLERVQKAS